MQANMKAYSSIKRKNTKIRQRRADKGKLSDNGIDNKKDRQRKMLARKVDRQRRKAERKAGKMDTS